ncbi:MAG: hypothetical protein GC171_13090 [Terrimonas sp.]|nr:hypothetical protein [Terrimonas sp.]
MEQLNFHKQKLYSLIAAVIAFIALLLPWTTINFMGMSSNSGNGLRSWGIVSLLGVAAVAIASLLNDKTQDYDANMKKLVTGGFAAIAVGALLYFIRIKSGSGNPFGGDLVKSGAGLWVCLVTGIAGVLYHMGIIKIPQK